MSNDSSDRVGRRPRYPVIECQTADVWIEQAGGRVAARLFDFSRHGVGLLTDEPVGENERVIVHIHHAKSGFDLSSAGAVRWERAVSEANWLIGLEFDEPVPLETLGELFLHEILATKAEV
jgi:hypothetical protein